MRLRIYFYLFISLFLSTSIFCIHTPVVIMHGIWSAAKYMEPVKAFVEQYLPGTYVKIVEIGDGEFSSLGNMQEQIDSFTKQIQDDVHLANGFHIIAHSQGCLISRAYIEQCSIPRVHSFIAWAGPNAGYFGSPEKLDTHLAFAGVRDELYHLFYTSESQRHISLAGYWKDPLHYGDYLARCEFLPRLNNEVAHELSEQYRANLCSLGCMVLVRSTADEVIEPLDSCHFGFYKVGSDKEVVSMEETAAYVGLGLDQLLSSGRLHRLWAHCAHTDFETDEHNFVNNTLPYLNDGALFGTAEPCLAPAVQLGIPMAVPVMPQPEPVQPSAGSLHGQGAVTAMLGVPIGILVVYPQLAVPAEQGESDDDLDCCCGW